MTILQTKSTELDLDFGDTVKMKDLMYLYERDGFFQFYCVNRVEDAMRYWVKDAGPKTARHQGEFIKAVSYAEAFGWAVMVFYDENPELMDPLDEAVEAMVYHPLCDNVGVKDPLLSECDELGYPKTFTISINNHDYKVDASRCVIFTARKSRNHWKAPPGIFGALDDIIALRKGRSAYSSRADKLSAAALHVHKHGEMNDTEVDAWEDALEGGAHVVTSDNDRDVSYDINRLEPALLAGEFDMTRDAHLQALAASWGIPKAFIVGAESGQKLSTDANQGMYYLSLIDLLRQYTSPIAEGIEKFGESFNGWNSPTEMPAQDKINNLAILVNLLGKELPPQVEKIILEQIERIGEI